MKEVRAVRVLQRELCDKAESSGSSSLGPGLLEHGEEGFVRGHRRALCLDKVARLSQEEKTGGQECCAGLLC